MQFKPFKERMCPDGGDCDEVKNITEQLDERKRNAEGQAGPLKYIDDSAPPSCTGTESWPGSHDSTSRGLAVCTPRGLPVPKFAAKCSPTPGLILRPLAANINSTVTLPQYMHNNPGPSLLVIQHPLSWHMPRY